MQSLIDTIAAWTGASWPAPVMAVVRVTIIAVLAVAALIAVGRLLRVLRRRITARITDPSHARRFETVTRVLRYVATALVALIAGTLILSELGVSIAPILGAAGIIGIAVGFGAQSLIKDYFTGFFLLLENQVTQGDIVRVADRSGVVEDITLRYMRLRDYEGNVHFVPNGLITTVTNMSRDFAYAVMDIRVAYREDLETVFAAMRETAQALRQDPRFAALILEPLEIAGVEDLADSAVVIRCRFKVRELEQADVRREFLRRIKTDFDARGIEIPHPHITVQVRDDRQRRDTPPTGAR